MRASVYMRVRGVEGEGQESPLSSRKPRALLCPGVRLCYLTCESPAEPCESSLILRPGCGSSSPARSSDLSLDSWLRQRKPLQKQWCSHFLPARVCYELAGPWAAENIDEYKNRKRALEGLRTCQSSESSRFPLKYGNRLWRPHLAVTPLSLFAL